MPFVPAWRGVDRGKARRRHTMAKAKEAREEMVLQLTKIDVKLQGIAPVLFDRFTDYSQDVKPPEQKLYLGAGNVVCMPGANITEGLLFGKEPGGAAKVFEGKKWADYIRMGLSHVFIDPVDVPFQRNGKPVILGEQGCKDEGWEIVMKAGRTKKGSLSIKQPPRPRPALLLPWELAFTITLLKNDIIDETKLLNWFTRAGLLIALGTYRPTYGRFTVANWDVRG